MPAVLSLSVVQVVRDGVIHRLPVTFLVEGDLIRLHYGELAPAHIRLVPLDSERAAPALEFEAGQCLHPSSLPRRVWSVYHPPHFDFICLSTPLCASLATVLHTVRPTPVMENQRNILHRLIVKRALAVLLTISLLVNILRAILLPSYVIAGRKRAAALCALTDGPTWTRPRRGNTFWPDLILLLPTTLLLSMLPLIMPSVWLVVSCYANAWLYCLFDALHVPADAAKDEDSGDELDFDAAPPAADVFVPHGALFAIPPPRARARRCPLTIPLCFGRE